MFVNISKKEGFFIMSGKENEAEMSANVVFINSCIAGVQSKMCLCSCFRS